MMANLRTKKAPQMTLEGSGSETDMNTVLGYNNRSWGTSGPKSGH